MDAKALPSIKWKLDLQNCRMEPFRAFFSSIKKMQLTDVKAAGPRKTATYCEKPSWSRWSKDPVKSLPLKPKAARKLAQKRPEHMTINSMACVSPRRSSVSPLAICSSSPSPAAWAMPRPSVANSEQHISGA